MRFGQAVVLMPAGIFEPAIEKHFRLFGGPAFSLCHGTFHRSR